MSLFKHAKANLLLGAMLLSPFAVSAAIIDISDDIVFPDDSPIPLLTNPGDTVNYLAGSSFDSGKNTVHQTNATINIGSGVQHTFRSGSDSTITGTGSVFNSGNILLEAGSTTTYLIDSVYEGLNGSLTESFGQILIGDTASILYSSGSTFINRNGGSVVNASAVTNYGSIVLDAGSTVTGTGSYTQMNGGSIVVNGELTQNTINIQGSGYLGGTGTINGNVYAAGDDVIINAGNSPGTLTINGNLVVENGARIILEVGDTAQDKVVVNGDLDLSQAEIVFQLLSGVDDSVVQQIQLMDFIEVEDNGNSTPLDLGAFSSAQFSVQSASGQSSRLSLTSSGGVNQVPEPFSAALVLLGLVGLWRRQQ